MRTASARDTRSFERTMRGLHVLQGLRREHEFTTEVRLVISRESSAENPAIVSALAERLQTVDAVSLNRLIRSRNAIAADSLISWEEARACVNETARRVRTLGWELIFESVPLCVFDGDNQEHIRPQVVRRMRRQAAGLEPADWRLRYIDPYSAPSNRGTLHEPADAFLAEPCVPCDCLSACGRVEGWYVDRYGASGLKTQRLA